MSKYGTLQDKLRIFYCYVKVAGIRDGLKESRYGYKQIIDSPSISTIMSSGMPPKKVSTNPQVLSNYNICRMKFPAKMKHIKHSFFLELIP